MTIKINIVVLRMEIHMEIKIIVLKKKTINFFNKKFMVRTINLTVLNLLGVIFKILKEIKFFVKINIIVKM